MSDGMSLSALVVASDGPSDALYRPPPPAGATGAATGLSLMPRLLEVLGDLIGEGPGRLVALQTQGRPRLADLAVAALDAIGSTDQPRDLILVQNGQDYAPTAALPLAEITERTAQPIREEFALSHLAGQGGTEFLDFADWAVLPGAEAMAVVTDRPFAVDAALGVPSGSVVAMCLTPGEGPVRVLDRRAHPAPDRVLSGPGPCGYWSELLTLLEEGELREGELVGLGHAPGEPGPAAVLRIVHPAGLRTARVELGTRAP